MDLQLAGKVFIVTGGSKGIGEGISRGLVAEDAIPVIATRSKAATDALVEEFDHMTFGSVSAFLARRVMCPLLIVPTHSE